MTLLKHQIVVHPDLAGQFASERRFTPYERRPGFSWYLCPVTVAEESEWLLVNAEFGYCSLVRGAGKTAADNEEAVKGVIVGHLPEDCDNVIGSIDPKEPTWHIADKMPEHVGLRYQQAMQLIGRCKERWDAVDEIERLNDTPLTLGDRTFAPTEGLEGLLEELADDVRHDIKHTPWWKLWWHALTRNRAWLK